MKPQDRIVDFRRVPARDLEPNPDNWRRHPPEQLAALRGLFAEIGFADVALAVERKTGRKRRLVLVDGHARSGEVDPDFPVPTIVLDLDDDEVRLLLATLDPIAGMALSDPSAIALLLNQIDTANDDVQGLLDRIAEDLTPRDPRAGIPPDEFPTIDPDALDTDSECPRCGYTW